MAVATQMAAIQESTFFIVLPFQHKYSPVVQARGQISVDIDARHPPYIPLFRKIVPTRKLEKATNALCFPDLSRLLESWNGNSGKEGE
jgi:hypothetical protein